MRVRLNRMQTLVLAEVRRSQEENTHGFATTRDIEAGMLKHGLDLWRVMPLLEQLVTLGEIRGEGGRMWKAL